MIIGKLTTGNIKWSDAFIVSNMSGAIMPWKKSESEHKYTSTGIKFWRHPDQMKAFKSNQSKTIISTHISPEGACNLKCPYCSVTYRDTHNRIELDRIKEYVTILKNYGLRAVILTGGGEPTLYRQFNELVLWLKAQDLSIGLITNGTQTDKISKAVIKCFSWVRVSVNIFDGWQEKIRFPYHDVSDDCVIGCSMVYTGEHEKSQNDQHDWLDLFRHVSSVADNCGATYVRVLPNCLLEQNQLLIQHEMLNKIIGEIGDSRFFQQYKIHKTPGISTCNQAYFRPYLSEESWHGDGTAGTVYPCDSVVLNQATAHFSKKFQICKPEDIGAFLEKRLNMNFEPKEACSGCVFADNVEMLEEWKHGTVDRFHEFPDPLKHEEFV
jgi:organic radical activating enzyme